MAHGIQLSLRAAGLNNSSLWLSALVGAIAGLTLGPTWQAAVLGFLAALAIGLSRPTVLLVIVVASAGINLAPTIDDTTVYVGGATPDLNVVRMMVILGSFVLLAVREPRILSAFAPLSALIAFACYGLVSMIWTPDRIEGIRFLLQLAYPLAAFALAVVAVGDGDRSTILRSVVWGSWLGMLVNLGVFLLNGSGTSETPFFRYHGSLGPNPLALFSAACCLALYAWSWREKGTLARLTALALLIQLAATGSRTALIALGCAFCVLEIVRRKWSRLVAIVAGATLIWFIVPAISTRPGLGIRVGGSSAVASVAQESNFSGRLFVWYDVWRGMISGGEVVGRGIGASTSYMASRYASLRSTHSEIVRLIAETGIVGIVLFSFGILWVGWLLIRNSRESDSSLKEDANVGLAALVLFTITCATENALNGYSYFVALILVFVAIGLRSERRDQVRELAPS
jgi:O-antigen ligase/polysaccharide polymerase Wzy-like membrane protein